jgi:tRNA nucleotidyltransferase (CCA-adding enzyme)
MPAPGAELVPVIAEAVRKDGRASALLVGGCVRDELLGREPKDLDVEVFGIPAPALRTLLDRLGKVDAVGESFAVYKVGGLDVALPRRESKSGRGHKGFVVDGDPQLSVVEAARRRDFTINAISRDPLTGEIVDPFDGRSDLQARRLRVVDPRTFVDDSLRVLRALQFVARFDLTVDDDTRVLRRFRWATCRRTRLGRNRETLLAAEPSAGGFARDLDIVSRLWPERTIDCPQEGGHPRAMWITR